MDLDLVFQNIKKSFTIRREVDFKEADLHIVLETPSSEDETKALSACLEFDGAEYVNQLKIHTLSVIIRQINDMSFEEDEVEFEEDGKKKKMSRYLFLLNHVKRWPSSLRDTLFTIYSNMESELDAKIKKDAKFEMFKLDEAFSEESDAPEGFRRVDESESDEGMTPVEKETKALRKEIEDADDAMAQATQKAVDSAR